MDAHARVDETDETDETEYRQLAASINDKQTQGRISTFGSVTRLAKDSFYY